MATTRIERGRRWLAIWVAGACWASAAAAQTWRIEPSAVARATATNNSGFGDSTELGGDVILDLIPRIALSGRGARFKLDGSIEADSLTYVRNTKSNEFIPKLQLAGNATAVERWVYLDAQAQVEQFSANPFSAATSGSLPASRRQTRQYRLSPYIDHAFTPSTSLLYRNDNVWTRDTTTDAGSGVGSSSQRHSHLLTFTQRPLPFGYALEAKQETADFTGNATSNVELASARAVLSYAVDPTLVLGAVVGAERNQIAASTSRDSIRGVRVGWRPTERTALDASAERRFFNNAWNLTGSHRSPFVAMNLTLSKEVASQPSALALVNSGNDLRTLIDAAYTTRFPNPVERAVIVDSVIASLGAAAGAAGQIAVFTDYAQLQHRASLSVALLSPLSTLTFNLFSTESLQLLRPDAPAQPLPPVNTDNAQLGGSVTLDRRLTSTVSIEAALSGVKIEGRGTSQGQASSTKVLSVSASQALTPKTRAIAGARRQLLNSNVVRPAQETAAFVGLEHRF
jgi:uncharacterized protein (PEP-CTERM system associated)